MQTMQKDSKPQTKDVLCDCGVTFTSEVVDCFGVDLTVLKCPKCIEQYFKNEAAQEQLDIQRKRDEEFEDRCPRGMRKFDRDRFPSDLDKHDRTMNAPVIDKGVLIHGRTGSGKSRTMWQLAKRLITYDQRSVIVMEDRAFGRLIERSYNEDNGEHDRLIRRFQNCSVLMIDDLGKSKMTERVESDLFDIIDHRYAEGKPMCFTTQFTGESLKARFGCKETGEAIVRRITEVTNPTYFKSINHQQ